MIRKTKASYAASKLSSQPDAGRPDGGGLRWGALVALLAAMAIPVTAEASQFGVRVGASMGNGVSYNSQEVYWRTGLPWGVGQPQSWHVRSALELNAGRLATSDDSLTTAGAGLHLRLQNPEVPVAVSGGIGPTYLSESQLADRDFGGHWQFTSHIGAFASLGPGIGVGYRIQHTSNGGLYSDNDGYTVQAVELRLSF
ncbi:hypothetical protein CAI21_10440 [Alkalilimnicola ehrlichii]|uniref:Acyloxyacyl hydrolase n=1 Tax=Alkalilimnicola ehrlichii TaxID=351052 RepID=A0A3E0WSY9_9GAMM|nr:acyloxyacyl hydrolase [Alkalilimnicola ehrlichii]RFA29178.1 hypothetical protein CAI21_10440 [Alkalilimnicola ehrlichii]RFA36090.1 hypothetical protein CAL65_11585 [Alkalilimnicola ehrlichii]